MTLKLLDTNGGKVERQTATVLLTIGSKQTTQSVALVPSESLGGMVLMAVDFDSQEDMALVDAYRKAEKVGNQSRHPIKAVLTRKQHELDLVDQQKQPRT